MKKQDKEESLSEKMWFSHEDNCNCLFDFTVKEAVRKETDLIGLLFRQEISWTEFDKRRSIIFGDKLI